MSSCTSILGQPAMDQNFSNTTIANNLTSCSGISSNLTRGNRFIVLNEQQSGSATYRIAPRNLSTIVKFSAPLESNTNLKFVMDNSNALVGDEMLWVIDYNNVETIYIDVPVSSFYYTACGEVTEIIDSDDFEGYTLVLPWIFDGESWLSTWDNY